MFKVFDPIIIRDINLSWRDGYISIVYSPLIGIRSLRLVITVFSYHPIVIISVRMRTVNHLIDP